MRYFKIILLSLFCISYTGLAREVAPSWVKKLPTTRNNTYQFQVFQVPSSNLTIATKQLPDVASYYIERQYNVKGTSVETFEHSQYSRGNQTINTQIENIRDTVCIESGAADLKLRIIDEYQCNNSTLFLCVLPSYNSPIVNYDKIAVTSKYGFKQIWPSFLVPGTGQMIKGNYLKGGLIMGGSVALAAGATLCSLTRQDYLAKMANTHNASVKQQYVTKANNLNTGMWTCVGCLAALYVYNIVDAFVTPGARRIIVTPAVSSEGQYGASVSYNF